MGECKWVRTVSVDLLFIRNMDNMYKSNIGGKKVGVVS